MRQNVVKVMKKILHTVEIVIAVMTIIVLLVMLGNEIYKMFTSAEYFSSVDTFMNGVLGIVIGLEFTRLLIDFTPGNTIELMSFAVARQFIISHDDPLSNIVAVVCIAGLFAIRRFLIPEKSMNVGMNDLED